MKIRQISVFIENKSGRLSDVIEFLGDNGINIRALSLADTSDFGILRLIVNEPEKAYTLLREKEFTVGATDVIAVAVPDNPGGLASVLKLLKDNDVSVEYMYAYVEHSSEYAVMIFRFEDTNSTLELLKKSGVKLLGGDEIYSK
ncbi:MAG: amino acid-binding protein [Deferribacterales bacterium]|nr:amino acid-binding protein [Deferribacterales bacterium]